jgi:hypothetical protein
MAKVTTKDATEAAERYYAAWAADMQRTKGDSHHYGALGLRDGDSYCPIAGWFNAWFVNDIDDDESLVHHLADLRQAFVHRAELLLADYDGPLPPQVGE